MTILKGKMLWLSTTNSGPEIRLAAMVLRTEPNVSQSPMSTNFRLGMPRQNSEKRPLSVT